MLRVADRPLAYKQTLIGHSNLPTFVARNRQQRTSDIVGRQLEENNNLRLIVRLRHSGSLMSSSAAVRWHISAGGILQVQHFTHFQQEESSGGLQEVYNKIHYHRRDVNGGKESAQIDRRPFIVTAADFGQLRWIYPALWSSLPPVWHKWCVNDPHQVLFNLLRLRNAQITNAGTFMKQTPTNVQCARSHTFPTKDWFSKRKVGLACNMHGQPTKTKIFPRHMACNMHGQPTKTKIFKRRCLASAFFFFCLDDNLPVMINYHLCVAYW